MKSASLLLLATLLAGVRAEGEGSEAVCHSDAKVQSLEGQLSDHRSKVASLEQQVSASSSKVAAHAAEVASLKEALAAVPAPKDDIMSVTAIAAQMGGILSNVVEEQLKKTDVDEQVYEKLTKAHSSVTEFSQGVIAQVSAVDYRAHLDSLKVGEKYNTHLAPHVEKATKAAQPIMEQHVHPHLEKASAALAPHFASVKEAGSKHYETLQTEILPKIKASATQAYDKVTAASKEFVSVEATLDKVLAPVFDFVAVAAPKEATALPTKPYDRLLLLVVTLVALYVLLRISWIVLKVGLKTTRIGAKVLLVLTKVGLLLPIRLVLRLLRLVLWFSTGFYCCGLCRRKAKAAAADSKTTNKSTEKAKKASLEEVIALLTEAQKKKKLDAAVKQAAALCKSEKPFTSPKNLEGKVITIDVLKGALKKMGVDSKGLL